MVKKGILVCVAAMLLLTACGTSGAITGASDPKADAASGSNVSKTIITNTCEDQKNPASGVTINNTNNCNKNNPITTTTSTEGGA